VIPTLSQKFSSLESISKLELVLIGLFLLMALAWGLSSAFAPSIPTPASQADITIQVFAYALPDKGWAPLQVFFSPFGSNDPTSTIIRYQWDLDGNGSFETDATAQKGYASYIYTKPRTYTISLRVTNSQGESAIAQTQVEVRHPASSSVDYWTVFDDSRVRKVEVRLTEANYSQMMVNPGAKIMVPADAVIFGEQVKNIGISPKGNTTIGFSPKLPFKLDLNANLPEQEYKNLKMLIFHNNFGDPSLLREKMAYDMMRFAGVNAGFTSYVEFWIDITDDDQPADYLGLYTMVERPDTKYLANRFGQENDQGNLYKADAFFEEGAADLAYYGPNIEDYPKPRGEIAYAPMYKDAAEVDFSDIIELCYVIDGVNYETPEEFAAALEKVFDVDGFLRYLAVIFLTLNFDQYPDTGNNYYLYHDPGSDRFEWIAWDMGNSWGHFGGGYDYPIFGAEHSLGPLQYRPLFTKVFEVEAYQRTYQAYLDLLIRNYFNEEQLGSLATSWHDLVRPHLQSGGGDKMFIGEEACYSLEEFDQGLQEIIALTSARADFIAGVIAKDQQ
jgi:spore coat protein H